MKQTATFAAATIVLNIVLAHALNVDAVASQHMGVARVVLCGFFLWVVNPFFGVLTTLVASIAFHKK